MRLWDSGFRGLGFRVEGLGFRVILHPELKGAGSYQEASSAKS